MKWYVAFVETGKEEEVQKWLDFYFDKETLRYLVPKRRLIEKKGGNPYPVIRKLFPGYVFICTDMDLKKYKKIISIPNLIRILNLLKKVVCMEWKVLLKRLINIRTGQKYS